jgi:hypothetical protein
MGLISSSWIVLFDSLDIYGVNSESWIMDNRTILFKNGYNMLFDGVISINLGRPITQWLYTLNWPRGW